MSLNRYLNIDVNNVAFAAQMTHAKLMSGDVETTSIFGLARKLRELVMTFKTNKVLALYDHSPTWRHEEFPAYKSNRDKNPQMVAAKAAIRRQRPLFEQMFTALGVDQFVCPRFEADDLAAHFSRGLSSRGAQVINVTGDHDWLQLVSANPSVAWFDHKQGGKLVTMVNFEEHTGYETPAKFAIAKCLQGDSSDTIPGVGGLGEKAAELLLKQFTDIDDLILRWPTYSVPKGAPLSRYRKKITDFVAPGSGGMVLYVRNERLMKLGVVPVPADKIQRIKGCYDEQALAELFKRFAFHSLLADFARWVAPFKPH